MLVKRGQSEGVFNTYVRTLPWEEDIASQIEMVKSQIVIEGAQEKLSEDLFALLKIVNDAGASVCVGTCEHRKPGELHCHNISRMYPIQIPW
jgi:hypothetical protein